MVYLHYLASVSKPEHPSERIVEQRMRNRAMEALEALSEGDEGVRSVGVGEFVEQAIEAEAQAQAICMQTRDFERAYNAFVAKQKPVFEGN